MTAIHRIEQFSIACRKTKTKVITLANHNRRKQRNEPIRIRIKFMYPAPSAGKSYEQVSVDFGLDSHWLRKWREFCAPITERIKAKPKQARSDDRDKATL